MAYDVGMLGKNYNTYNTDDPIQWNVDRKCAFMWIVKKENDKWWKLEYEDEHIQARS